MRIVGAALLVFAVIRIEPAILKTRAAQLLGEISFSIYLVHMLVLVTFTAWVFSVIDQRYLIGEFFVYLASAWMAATVFQRLVETRALSLSRQVKAAKARLPDAALPAPPV